MDESGFLSMALSVVSGLLTLLMSILWYQWRQALDRISKLETYKEETMTAIAKLSESAINREQLAESSRNMLRQSPKSCEPFEQTRSKQGELARRQESA